MKSLFFDTMLFYLPSIVSLADCFLLWGEANTVNATTAGILTTLQYCIELIGQREHR